MPDVQWPLGFEDWSDLLAHSPQDPMLRARLAAELIRAGHFDDAERELTTCLEIAPIHARPRLLIVVLRQRVKMAARRSALVQADLEELHNSVRTQKE